MSILYRARFVTSAAHVQQLPSAGPPEVCFVGRSNVGKSSTINVLTNQRRLAHASKTPGRTRLINFFGLPDPQIGRASCRERERKKEQVGQVDDGRSDE